MRTGYILLLFILLLLFSCSSKLEVSLKNLDSKEKNVRIDTLEKLRGENPSYYKKVLLKAFEDSESDVVWRAIDISGHTHDRDIVEKLIIFLSSDDPLISYCAKDALIRIGPESEQILLDSFDKHNDKTKILILKCLNKLGTFKTVNFSFQSESDYILRYINRTYTEISEREIKKELEIFVSELADYESKRVESKK